MYAHEEAGPRCKRKNKKPMKYAIGIQSFETIRRDGYVYVDKTDLVYKLANGPANDHFTRLVPRSQARLEPLRNGRLTQ